ncbi:Pentatricopeptide repeat [Macleaya cordata]|uniref:Pentatricopeptide repeat n=1 Tax=Macleaya cordata TaxID=56857 RepID=A0A200PW63_MACCD|nr:Pentatricopeptide repeat [Macleaya cordata]
MLSTVGKSIPAISLQNPAETFSSLFNFTKSLHLIKQLHAQIVLNGFHHSILFGSQISNAYIDMGSLENAFKAFDQISLKNPRSWNTIISGFNLVFAIKACIGLSVLQNGKSFHSVAIKSGLEDDPYVGPALINMYIQLGGSLEETRKVFDKIYERNSVSWGAMMKGCLKFSKDLEVFELFDQMKKFGFELDPYSLDGLVQACGNVCAGKDGSALHGLIDFAVELFIELEEKDVVMWSTIIAGLTKNGRACEAISFFRRMLDESIMPNEITFSSVILACSQLGTLQQGKSVHGFAIRNGIKLDVVNCTSLIDMYAKCGSIEVSRRVFNVMPERDVFSWSVMINGFGIHGLYYEALSVFTSMRSQKHVPNSITFVSILSACSHSGKVEEGWDFFELMSRDFGITPIEEHYACMVDLLSRAGKIEEAESLIEKMPMDPGASIWGALLSACRIHKRVELAEKVAEKLLVLEPDQSSVYVMLSNIYAAAGKWEMVKKIRRKMSKKGLQKIIGFSSIEIEQKVYVFGAKDRLSYNKTGVESVLIFLRYQMQELGYMPDIRFGLQDFDD